MDIRDWPLDQVMQLPDHVFGQRWMIAFGAEIATTVTAYYISEMALPERCVIWELFASMGAWGGIAQEPADIRYTYKLSDQIPVIGNFGAMDSLFKGIDYRVIAQHILLPIPGVLHLRKVIESAGRRICLRVINGTSGTIDFHTGIVISSVPREVPDWLISENLRSR